MRHDMAILSQKLQDQTVELEIANKTTRALNLENQRLIDQSQRVCELERKNKSLHSLQSQQRALEAQLVDSFKRKNQHKDAEIKRLTQEKKRAQHDCGVQKQLAKDRNQEIQALEQEKQDIQEKASRQMIAIQSGAERTGNKITDLVGIIDNLESDNETLKETNARLVHDLEAQRQENQAIREHLAHMQVLDKLTNRDIEKCSDASSPGMTECKGSERIYCQRAPTVVHLGGEHEVVTATQSDDLKNSNTYRVDGEQERLIRNIDSLNRQIEECQQKKHDALRIGQEC